MSNTYAVCPTCDGEGDVAPTELSTRQKKRLAHPGKAPQRQPCMNAPAEASSRKTRPGGPPKVAIVGGGSPAARPHSHCAARRRLCCIRGRQPQNERPGLRADAAAGLAGAASLGVVVRGTTPTGHASFDSTGRTPAPTRPRKWKRPITNAQRTSSASAEGPRRRRGDLDVPTAGARVGC